MDSVVSTHTVVRAYYPLNHKHCPSRPAGSWYISASALKCTTYSFNLSEEMDSSVSTHDDPEVRASHPLEDNYCLFCLAAYDCAYMPFFSSNPLLTRSFQGVRVCPSSYSNLPLTYPCPFTAHRQCVRLFLHASIHCLPHPRHR